MKLSRTVLLLALAAAALGPWRARAQNLFVADAANQSLVEMDPSGVILNTTPIAGAGAIAGLAFDKTGNLFVADYDLGNIYELSPGGTQSTFASGLGSPLPLAFDTSGNLFAANLSGVIYEIAPDGSVSTFASVGQEVYGLAFDTNDNLFAGVLFADAIIKYSPGGTSSVFAGGGITPYGLVFDGAGNLFAAQDSGSGNIWKFAPNGNQSTFASGFASASALAFDTGSGNLFVATYTGSIYRIASDGTSTLIGSGFGAVAGIAVKHSALGIVTQPQSQLSYWGMSATFSVGAAYGRPPYTFQWMKANAPISGATNSVLTLTNLQATDAATYTVVVSDSVTNITSQPATLTVEPAGTTIALHTGVDIFGVVGQTYGVQATTNLNLTTSWIGLANVTLTTTNQTIWYDPIPAVLAHRFYRVVPGPITIP